MRLLCVQCCEEQYYVMTWMSSVTKRERKIQCTLREWASDYCYTTESPAINLSECGMTYVMRDDGIEHSDLLTAARGPVVCQCDVMKSVLCPAFVSVTV